MFVSDHGDMLGERGLWFKMCFYEGSARVPMMIKLPDIAPRLVKEAVSNIDVTPTLCDIAGVYMDEVMPWTQGESLLPYAKGTIRTSVVAMEYAAEASYAPLVSLRKGPWKYNRCLLDPEKLFDLETDPHELNNLAQSADHEDVLLEFQKLADERWNLELYDQSVRHSQARRWIVYEALRNGNYYPWDYQPLQKASERYMRNHMDLNEVEDRQRYPKD